jgi:ribose transport system ATP-binding protein/rhamnose transport system ATP-binding protein
MSDAFGAVHEPPLLVIRASKRYGSNLVLDNASLELLPGEAQALIGENGAGKSTLIKILAGVVRADKLELSLRGEPVTISSSADAYKHGLRFIHQELVVIPQLSVAENLFLQQLYPTRAGFIHWSKLNVQAQAMLNQLGVHHIDVKQKMSRLSIGDKMLVKIAASLVGEGNSTASMYVLDEPTAALSAAETETLFKVIDTLKARGCAVVYVSHRLEEIFNLCNRVTVMRDGRTIASKAIAETTPSELIQLMTARDLSQMYPPREKPVSKKVLLSVKQLRSKVLKDVNFDLHEGEILGIAGLAGSGQSDLLLSLMGDKHQGQIVLDNKPLKRISPSIAWADGLAFVPSERRTQGLMLGQHIGHNVALPHLWWLSFAGFIQNRSNEKRLAEQMGKILSLKAQSVFQKVRELSGGNQQKVLFARALAKSPKVLLLDEPTRGVDVGAKTDIYRFIRQVSSQGRGIVLSSSDLGELLGLCDRILILNKGWQIAIVSSQGLTQSELLTCCYQGMSA